MLRLNVNLQIAFSCCFMFIKARMLQHKIYYMTSFPMRCMSLNKIIACHCFVSLFSPELLYDISLQDNSYPTVNCWCFSVLWKKFDRYMLHYIWFDISPYLTFDFCLLIFVFWRILHNVMFDPAPSPQWFRRNI